jgi:hypothetical protein
VVLGAELHPETVAALQLGAGEWFALGGVTLTPRHTDYVAFDAGHGEPHRAGRRAPAAREGQLVSQGAASASGPLQR